jgi:hypothetical protein
MGTVRIGKSEGGKLHYRTQIGSRGRESMVFVPTYTYTHTLNTVNISICKLNMNK